MLLSELLSLTLAALVMATSMSSVLVTREAFAQKPADSKSKARDLFKAGAKAIEQGKHAEGLPMVEQAEGLFHAPTHLLWIARGKVGLNQLLEARDTYKKLIDEQLPANASDAFKEAQATASTELAALEKRIPKLVVKPRPESAPGLKITMNGEALGPERLGVPFDVVPGSFTFQARADGLEASNVTVDAVERSTTEVRLVLHPFGQKGPEDSGVRVVTKQDDWPAMKIAGVALMAGGGAALAAGGAMGALHFVKSSEADDKYAECGASCRDDVESLDGDAALFGNLAIGLLAGGGAVLGTGIVLFAVAPSESDSAAPPPVSLTFAPGFVSVEGRF